MNETTSTTDPTQKETVSADDPIFGESDHDRHPVEILADEFSARWRAGETPSIAEYEQRAPEHRETIRSLFSTISILERMIRQEQAERRSHQHSMAGRKHLGDFRIIREIGRGGMGIVYEAIQRSLGRRVALKVLGAGISSSPLQLERFRREAESAARLHHTNIVPVFGIGEDEGTHFYAMQFIDGVPLADAIKAVRERSSAAITFGGKTPSLVGDTAVTGESVLAAVSSGSSNPTVDDPTVLMTLDANAEVLMHSESSSEEHSTDKDLGSFNQSEHSTASDGAVDFSSAFFANNNSPEYCLRIASLAAQVADALEYAHQHGVLHRDIKPSNLMLDRNGDVWIMDFGLVKILEQKDLTVAGEIVGTLRYMAPEQLQGRSDVRTDVYGLGLTLFELLTFRPAFDGNETVTLAQRLRQSEIPRPRSINPTIPKDLETIILKATANEPFARYPTAMQLAEDLKRFCEDQPILARPTTYLERLWRWSRRNPALATATGSTIFLLGLVAIVASAGWVKVNSARVEAEIAQGHAEANLDSAISAFDNILENVGSRGLPRSLAFDIPESENGLSKTALSDADVQLLDQLLLFYRAFASQNGDNSRLRAQTADAHHRAGAILVRLGRLTEAEADFRTAIELLLTTLKTDRHRTSLVVKTASIYNDLGELLLRRGEFDPTFKAHLEARAILLGQPESVRADPSVRFELARATDLFASIDIRSGTDSGPGKPPLGPPPGGRRLSHEQRPPPGQHRPPEGSNHGDNRPPPRDAGGPGPRGRPPEGLDERLKAALPVAFASKGTTNDRLATVLLETSDEFRSLAGEFPGNTDYQFRLAQCLRHRVVHAASSGNSDVAKETFLEAIQILDRLNTKFPNDPRFHFELADTLTQASRAQSGKEAEQSLDRAVSLAEQLAGQFPLTSEYQLLLGTALLRRAANQATLGSTNDAEESLKKAIDTLDRLARQFPRQGVIEIPLAKTCQQLGDLRRTTADDVEFPEQRLEESREILVLAIERFQRYLSTHQNSVSFNVRTRSALYLSLAETLTRLHLPEQAEQARRNATD